MQPTDNLWPRFTRPDYTQGMAAKIREVPLPRKLRFMEVCGTHTVNIARFGLRNLLGRAVEMVSGPGCPVCVTHGADIDLALELAREKGVTVATFGDVMGVPGSDGSLWTEKARGRDIRVVYSPRAALDMARRERGKQVVFLAFGFETTIPAVLLTLERAMAEKIPNFSLLAFHKRTPPAVRALLAGKDCKIDGFILPGHVSTVIGRRAWDFIDEDFSLPAVIAGFDAADILSGIHELLKMTAGKPRVLNAYRRAVTEEGNPRALHLLETYLELFAASWRGLGVIPDSGLKLKEEFHPFDAAKRFGLTPQKAAAPRGCICGDILKGKSFPSDCPLFAGTCRPDQAVGPCMVSSEGACGAYYKYGRRVLP